MNLGVDDLHRQQRCQLRQRNRLGTVKLGPHSSGRTLHTERGPPTEAIDLSEHHKPVAAATNQVLQPSCAKRAASAEDINRLEHTGLARGIRPANQSKSGIEIESRRLQAAEIRYLQAAK